MPRKSRSRLSHKRSKASRSRSRSRTKSKTPSTTGTDFTSASATSTNLSTGDLTTYSDLSRTSSVGSRQSVKSNYTKEHRKKAITLMKLIVACVLLIGGAILAIGINLWKETKWYSPMEGSLPKIVPRSGRAYDSKSYVALQIQNLETKMCIDDLGLGDEDKWVSRLTLGFVGYLGMRRCNIFYDYSQYFVYTSSGQFGKNKFCWKYGRWDGLKSITMQLLECTNDHGNEYVVITENGSLYVPYYDKCQTPFAATSVHLVPGIPNSNDIGELSAIGLYLEECRPVKYQQWIFRRVQIRDILYHDATKKTLSHPNYYKNREIKPSDLSKTVTNKPKGKIKSHT